MVFAKVRMRAWCWGLLAAVMIFGALVYEVVVNFILDPSTVPAVTQGDSSQTPTAVRSPVEAYLPPVSSLQVPQIRLRHPPLGYTWHG